MDGISAYIKGTLESPLALFPSCEDTMKGCQSLTKKRVLTRHRIYWYLDLGLSSLQSCEK